MYSHVLRSKELYLNFNLRVKAPQTYSGLLKLPPFFYTPEFKKMSRRMQRMADNFLRPLHYLHDYPAAKYDDNV